MAELTHSKNKSNRVICHGCTHSWHHIKINKIRDNYQQIEFLVDFLNIVFWPIKIDHVLTIKETKS